MSVLCSFPVKSDFFLSIVPIFPNNLENWFSSDVFIYGWVMMENEVVSRFFLIK